MHISFIDSDTVPLGLDKQKPNFEHVWKDYHNLQPKDLPSILADTDIIVTNKVNIDIKLLKKIPKLKMIAVAATGYDNIDTNACKENGVLVYNTPDFSTQSVTEHIFALLLSLCKNVRSYHSDVCNGMWSESNKFCLFNYPILDLAEKTIAIVGKGNIGKQTANIAQAFGMKPIFTGRKGEKTAIAPRVPWQEALSIADFISISVPKTPKTIGMFTKEDFLIMKDSSILINTARGEIIKEQDLADALDNKQIGGAALDVLREEPPIDPASHPLLSKPRDNLIITPHIAWSSKKSLKNLWIKVIQNIEDFAASNFQTPNRVA